MTCMVVYVMCMCTQQAAAKCGFSDIKVAMQARPRRIKCVSGERNTGDLRDYRIITCSQRVGALIQSGGESATSGKLDF